MNTLRKYPIFAALALFALTCQLAISFGHVHVAGHRTSLHYQSGQLADLHHRATHSHREPHHLGDTSASPAQNILHQLGANLNAAKAAHPHEKHDHHDHAPENGPHEDDEPCFACVLKHLSGSVILPAPVALKIDERFISRTDFGADPALVAFRPAKYTQARAPPSPKRS